MNRVKILIIAIFLTSLTYAEQSVYSDSDFVDSSTIAKKNSLEIFKLKEQIAQLKESIEGLKSLVNGQSNEISMLKQRNNDTLEKIVNQLSQRVAQLEARPAQVIKIQDSVSEKTSNNEAKNNSIKENKKAEVKPLSNKDLYTESVLNFTKDRLTKAETGFKELLKKAYKKASVNFYLGEISYKKGRYKDAIDYYQMSATLNDNASYMSKLLLHTAISLTKKGKKQDAKIFFKAVVDGYPNTQEAKEAKKYLK